MHGNARYLLVGEAGADGPSLSTGFGMGTWFSNLANFTFTVPLTVGVRNGNTDLFAGPVVSAYPLGDAGTVIAWSIEAGGAVTTSGFPIYASLVYGQTFGVDLIGFNIGFGYNLKM